MKQFPYHTSHEYKVRSCTDKQLPQVDVAFTVCCMLTSDHFITNDSHLEKKGAYNAICTCAVHTSDTLTLHLVRIES